MSAMKAGMSRKTAGKYLRQDNVMEQRQVAHTWRTRKDPLEEIWPQALAMLRDAPELEAKALFGHLAEGRGDEIKPGLLRTFQRRVKTWRLAEGPEKEVFFTQDHKPGGTLAVDWTDNRFAELETSTVCLKREYTGDIASLDVKRSVIAGNGRLANFYSTTRSIDIHGSGASIPGFPTLSSLGYNFIGSGTGVNSIFVNTGDSFGPNNENAQSPRLAALGDYGGPTRTRPPAPDSPLVDAIPSTATPFLSPDARGTARPSGVQGDIGAVELSRVAFTTWNLQIPNSGQRGAGADPDADGLVNAMEYFFGSNPNSKDGQPLVIEMEDGSKIVEFTRSALVRPAFFTTARIERSTNLTSWSPMPGEPMVEPVTPGSLDQLRYRWVLPASMDLDFVRAAINW